MTILLLALVHLIAVVSLASAAMLLSELMYFAWRVL